MGNFSRDTFDGLNQYVGVRLQQGVPLVDADLNELEDIRRFELRAYLKWFVGDGVPAGNNGFAIVAMPAVDNDFGIVGGDGTAQGAGRCLVDGLDVFNDDDLRYSQQLLVDTTKATAMGVDPVDPITTPGVDTTLRVYLDVWEREIFPGDPGDDQDIFDRNLINEDIGVPTCTRLKREWVVRVADTNLPTPLPVAEHIHYPLADISRRAGDPTVNPEDIVDLRSTGLQLQSQHDIDQITQDAFGAGYNLDGDGQPELKLSLRETMNSLLRGEVPATPIEAITLDSSSNALPKFLQDSHGNSWYFWLSTRSGTGFDVWYNRYSAATQSWDGETRISVDAGVNYNFSVLEDLGGNIWVFWDSSFSGNREIWYDRFISSSEAWDGNNQISSSTDNAFYHQVLIDQNGNIWVFWDVFESSDYNIWYDRYIVSTGSWDGPIQHITDPGNHNRQPTAVIDLNNNIWLFWYSNRSGNDDIWFNQYTDATSSWGGDTQMTNDLEDDEHPQAIVDRAGVIWLFWLSDRDGDDVIWYRRHLNGSWGEDIQLTTISQDVDRYFDLNLDSKGDVWIVWTEEISGRSDVWYTRNSLGSWDIPRNISHNRPEPSSRLPSISTDAEGDIKIAWSTLRPGGVFEFDSWYRTVITSI